MDMTLEAIKALGNPEQRWPRRFGQNGGLVKLSPGSFYAAIWMPDTVFGACPGDGVGAG